MEESGGPYSGADGIANGPKALAKALTGKMQALSREARSNQRRLLTAFGIDTDSDLLKFNQLKVGLEIIDKRSIASIVEYGTDLICSNSFFSSERSN